MFVDFSPVCIVVCNVHVICWKKVLILTWKTIKVAACLPTRLVCCRVGLVLCNQFKLFVSIENDYFELTQLLEQHIAARSSRPRPTVSRFVFV